MKLCCRNFVFSCKTCYKNRCFIYNFDPPLYFLQCTRLIIKLKRVLRGRRMLESHVYLMSVNLSRLCDDGKTL